MKKRIYQNIFLILLFASQTALWAQVERREKGNLIIEGIPEIPQRIKEKMMRYQNTRSASIQDWDPCGKGMLIATRFGETTQLHLVEKPGGARYQITFFDEPVGDARMCPDKDMRGFLFTKDVGGNEFYQIYFYNLDNGEYTLLSDGSSKYGGIQWSNNGDRFAYFSTRRNKKDWDLYTSTIKHPQQIKLILKKGGVWVPVDWSPDDKRLLVLNYISVNESYYHILDIESGTLVPINPKKEKISHADAVWSMDGKGIYITSDDETGFLTLRYYDIKRKRFKHITADIPWNAQELEISEQDDKLAFSTNEDGISKLYLLDTKTLRYKQVPGIPPGQVYEFRFHPSGKKLAFAINTSQTPGDIYVLDCENNSLKRWTYSEVGGLNTKTFITPDLIHYETFDTVNGKKRIIPAFYYKPNTASPYPVLIKIHGGPESQYRPYFSSETQYFVKELGVAVLVPNVRGSYGYGKEYLKLDNGYKREHSVKDIGKLLEWIEKQPELDKSRVAVIGGSYGGYMVLSSMTHFNDKLTCGIDIVGISNFVTFLKNTKEYRQDLRRAEYGDERDPKMKKFLLKISPTTNVHKISKPMFIVQGLNDPRVPVTESEQMVSEIRKNKGTVWYLLSRDEGHGFKKKSNRDYYTNAVILFLEKYLLPE